MPSTNGRNGNGTFAAGNPGGPGNPHARRVAEVRSILLGSVTDSDIQQIIKVLVEQAKSGDVVAAREILDRMIGKSVQAVALDAKLGIQPEPAVATDDKDDERCAILRAAGWPLEEWPPRLAAVYRAKLAANPPALPDATATG